MVVLAVAVVLADISIVVEYIQYTDAGANKHKRTVPPNKELRNKICRRPPEALQDRPVHTGRTNCHHSNHDTESECSQRGIKETVRGATGQDRRKHGQAHREAGGEQKEKAGAAGQEDYNTSRKYDKYHNKAQEKPQTQALRCPQT